MILELTIVALAGVIVGYVMRLAQEDREDRETE